jgi:NitT/TauT family transport system ATP-binding protein
VVLLSSSPGRVKLDRPVELPRPRKIDSAGEAVLTAELTAALREEVAAHVA